MPSITNIKPERLAKIVIISKTQMFHIIYIQKIHIFKKTFFFFSVFNKMLLRDYSSLWIWQGKASQSKAHVWKI